MSSCRCSGECSWISICFDKLDQSSELFNATLDFLAFDSLNNLHNIQYTPSLVGEYDNQNHVCGLLIIT